MSEGDAPGRAPAPDRMRALEKLAAEMYESQRETCQPVWQELGDGMQMLWMANADARLRGAAPPAPRLTPAEQAQLDAHWPWTGSKGPGMDWANPHDVIALLKARLGVTGTAGQQPIEENE